MNGQAPYPDIAQLHRARIWTDPESRHRWVFGMHWTPTLDRRRRRILLDQLGEQGMRWCASSGSSGELIGVVLDESAGPVDRTVASAALAFASHHLQGTHVIRLSLGGNQHWISASNQGQVVSQTDRWFEDGRQADVLIAELEQRFGDVVVQAVTWADPETEPAPAGLGWLDTTSHALARLHRLRPIAGWGNVLSLSVVLVAFALLAWTGYRAMKSPSPVADSELPTPVVPDAFIQNGMTLRAHSGADISVLLGHWDRLPLQPPGWLLLELTCSVQERSTRCEATYRRLVLDTDNRALADFAPTGWLVEQRGLNKTALTREIDLPGQTLAVDRERQRDWMVVLQRQSQQTPFIDLGPAQTGVRGGHTVSFRSIAMRLPMRHRDRLVHWHLPVRLTQVRLEVSPGAPIDEHSGALMLQLKGELLVFE